MSDRVYLLLFNIRISNISH
uniref:Uncharacterized protein n=1 Tax=Rhizophora mucronata TaxID=61149 RepID=A0A2P2Q659_RHIMU